jgi:hypothetical protein
MLSTRCGKVWHRKLRRKWHNVTLTIENVHGTRRPLVDTATTLKPCSLQLMHAAKPQLGHADDCAYGSSIYMLLGANEIIPCTIHELSPLPTLTTSTHPGVPM